MLNLKFCLTTSKIIFCCFLLLNLTCDFTKEWPIKLYFKFHDIYSLNSLKGIFLQILLFMTVDISSGSHAVMLQVLWIWSVCHARNVGQKAEFDRPEELGWRFWEDPSSAEELPETGCSFNSWRICCVFSVSVCRSLTTWSEFIAKWRKWTDRLSTTFKLLSSCQNAWPGMLASSHF